MSTVTSPAITSVLQSRREIAQGTMAFRFEKPSGWQFTAGQFLDLTLIDPPETDAEGKTRSFSIASAPDEDTLMVATRTRDTAFKRVMKTMPIGAAVTIEGPSGDLTLPAHSARPVVLLAGGIGITPFRSMLVHASRASREKPPHRMFLFYSNRRPEDAPFLAELRGLAKENQRFTLVATMSEMSSSQRPWSGETGLIDHPMLARHLKGIVSPVYYVAGPPAMVRAVAEMLEKQSVPHEDIHAEEFSGY
jgi:ferredoxin-NADP reductase